VQPLGKLHKQAAICFWKKTDPGHKFEILTAAPLIVSAHFKQPVPVVAVAVTVAKVDPETVEPTTEAVVPAPPIPVVAVSKITFPPHAGRASRVMRR